MRETKPMAIPRYKVVLLGDGGVGKTTLINILVDHQFSRPPSFTRAYIPTLGVDVHPVCIGTEFILDIWDTAGQEKFGGLREGYYINADLAIVMADSTAKVTCTNAQTWANDFRRVCPNSPIIYLLNKTDITHHQVGKLQNSISISCKNPNVVHTVIDHIKQHL